MTIGEVSKLAGIRPSALRYYESMKLLRAPHRLSGRRDYNVDVLDSVRLIRLAQEAGFTIQEIRVLVNGFSAQTPPSARWNSLAKRKLVEVNALLEKAKRMQQLLKKVLSCECPALSDCTRMLGVKEP